LDILQDLLAKKTELNNLFSCKATVANAKMTA